MDPPNSPFNFSPSSHCSLNPSSSAPPYVFPRLEATAAMAPPPAALSAVSLSCCCSASTTRGLSFAHTTPRWQGLDFSVGNGVQFIENSSQKGRGRCESNFTIVTPVRLFGCRTWSPRVAKFRKSCRRVQAGEQQAEEGEGNVEEEKEPVDYRLYQALMRGGEEVASVLKEMTELLEDITQMGEQGEQVAVEMAATGVLGQRLDKLDESFLMALDYMIKQADRDDKQRWLLEVIKDVVLAQLARKFPAEVQIVGILCRTPDRDARQEVLRRCAGGGGTFDQVGGGKIELPSVNISEVGDQADEIISTMEEKAKVEDRRLLARLVLVREESRSLLSGGVQDERIEKNKLRNLPEPEVNFLTKIIGLKPGPDLHKKLARVLGGEDEGADIVDEEKVRQLARAQSAARSPIVSRKEPPPPVLPVRPGLFIETVNKVLGGMYVTNTATGVTVQHMEWIRKETLEILQSMAF